MGILLVGYILYNKKEVDANRKKNTEIAKLDKKNLSRIQQPQDSIARIHNPKRDSIAHTTDSIAQITKAGIFQHSGDTIERTSSLDNDLIRVTFTNKGGQVKK